MQVARPKRPKPLGDDAAEGPALSVVPESDTGGADRPQVGRLAQRIRELAVLIEISGDAPPPSEPADPPAGTSAEPAADRATSGVPRLDVGPSGVAPPAPPNEPAVAGGDVSIANPSGPPGTTASQAVALLATTVAAATTGEAGQRAQLPALPTALGPLPELTILFHPPEPSAARPGTWPAFAAGFALAWLAGAGLYAILTM